VVRQIKKYTMVLLGDSMIDTLGTNAPELKGALTSLYPDIVWNIINYGVGATTIDYGIERITNSYFYRGKTFPALVTLNPDLIIAESFAYNPYPDNSEGLILYTQQLKKLIDTIHKNLPRTKIIFAVTIAPNSYVFGDGAPAISFTRTEKIARTNTIKSYLTTAIQFAHNNNIPLADLYHTSLTESNDGNVLFISSGDHIHYSLIGRMLFAQKITETLQTNHLIP
jgi:hypothetical protein